MKKSTPSKVVIIPHPPVPQTTATPQSDTVSTCCPKAQPAAKPAEMPESKEEAPDTVEDSDKS